jgi:hypothetical protein
MSSICRRRIRVAPVNCAELRNEPVVISFPLADAAEHRFTGPARAGAYSGPEFGGVSARIEGRYMTAGSWHDFVASSDLTGIQELALEPHVQVRANETTKVTLRLDLARVFLNSEGTALVDPTGGVAGSNAELVRDNIRMALHAFGNEN